MRTTVSRLLLLALAAVAVVTVILRVGDDTGSAAVSLDGLGPNHLKHVAFKVTETGRVAVEMGGSFESGKADTVWAASGWVTRRETGEPAWRPRGQRPERGTFAIVRDTVTLERGIYDAYFVSYGDPILRVAGGAGRSLGDRIRDALSRGGRAWHGDASRWRLRLTPLTQDRAMLRAMEDSDREDPARTLVEAGPPLRVWASGPLNNDERRVALLRVTAPTTVTLRATGEVADGVVADSAALIRLGDDEPETVWSFAEAETHHAGGSVKNRSATARVDLTPGLYQVVASTDRSHAYDDWEANPPYAPWLWGVTVERAAPDAPVALLRPADPDLDLPEIVAFRCVGTDSLAQATVTVTEEMPVLVASVGEIVGGSVYDYATLERMVDGEARRVWEQSARNSTSAGGGRKNQVSSAVLPLGPGTYRLTYRTDGSHDCSHYNAEPPDNPNFWGVVLYAVSPAYDGSAVSVSRGGRPHEVRQKNVDAEETPAPPSSQNSSEVLVDLRGLNTNEEVEASFTLDRPASIRIAALGEISDDERYDYGWIENGRGERIWEMRRGNTVPAGGADRNRRFDGRLRLDAGTYTVHFLTDDSHDGGRFYGEAPDSPADWGIRVVRAEDR